MISGSLAVYATFQADGPFVAGRPAGLPAAHAGTFPGLAARALDATLSKLISRRWSFWTMPFRLNAPAVNVIEPDTSSACGVPVPAATCAAVTCHSVGQALAPSSRAASSSVFGTVCRPASMMMKVNPMVCHQSIAMIAGSAQWVGSVLVPTAGGTTTVDIAGLNGRTWVAGDLVHVANATASDKVSSQVGQRIPLMPPLGELYVAWEGEDAIAAWLARGSHAGDAAFAAVQRHNLDLIRQRGFQVALRGRGGQRGGNRSRAESWGQFQRCSSSLQARHRRSGRPQREIGAPGTSR